MALSPSLLSAAACAFVPLQRRSLQRTAATHTATLNRRSGDQENRRRIISFLLISWSPDLLFQDKRTLSFSLVVLGVGAAVGRRGLVLRELDEPERAVGEVLAHERCRHVVDRDVGARAPFGGAVMR